MGVNEIDFRGLNASRGLNNGLQLGAQLGSMYRGNRLQDQELERAEQQRIVDDMARDALNIKQAPNMGLKRELLLKRIQQGEAAGRDMSDSRAVLALPDDQFNLEIDRVISKALPVSTLAGYDTSAGEREFKALVANLSPEDQEKARRIKLGLDARAVGSAAMTTATTDGLTEEVAGSEAVIAGAKSGASEEAKLKQQQIYLPKINAAVKEAEQEAVSRGEALSDLKRAKVAMPALLEAVGNLKSLAPLATSTFAGRAFDMAAKELGFGATDGATARAKYVAIVDNQVLPLLKQTFGAAFTVKEGESLKATLGDPNASPAEKMAQLDAFIEQKTRDIETKERQAGQAQDKPQSIDDLVNKYAN